MFVFSKQTMKIVQEIEKMKKICITAFCIVILFVAVSVILPSAASNSYIRGDTDCDGVVTICDVTEIQRSLADLATPSFDKRAAAKS